MVQVIFYLFSQLYGIIVLLYFYFVYEEAETEK